MKISQSAIKSFYDENFCELKWEKFFVEGYRSTPTAAMIDGLVFEELTIGSTRDNESFIGMIPRLKNGNVSKREADLVYLSEFAKKTMKDLDIKIIEVQPEWETDELIGHPDALIKYKAIPLLLNLLSAYISNISYSNFFSIDIKSSIINLINILDFIKQIECRCSGNFKKRNWLIIIYFFNIS